MLRRVTTHDINSKCEFFVPHSKCCCCFFFGGGGGSKAGISKHKTTENH